MFVDRQLELDFLNSRLTNSQPGPGQLILLYGRRRVGKTELLKEWALQSGLKFIYWTADKEPAASQRRSFLATVLEMAETDAPNFDSWPALWRWLAPRLADSQKQQILIIDELSYATAVDSSILSALQHAWDHHLKESKMVIALCGSQMTTMEAIMQHQSPLFGRFTGQWHLQTMPFSSLNHFFPTWSIEERVALYTIVGGVPAYLRWLNAEQGLVDNIRHVILQPGNVFLSEPELLLYDELRDLSNYHAILRSIGKGYHGLGEISNDCLISATSLSPRLAKLQALRLIERRLPVTLTTAAQRKSKKSRYHISDPFFKFYYRFLYPHLRSITAIEETTKQIKRELRAYVGIGFEQLAQQWVIEQNRRDQLPFELTAVGSHWSRKIQIDVVGINHETRQLLIGECKWGQDPVARDVVRDLVERKGMQLRRELLNSDDWTITYALFTRSGLTSAAGDYLASHGGVLVDLERLNDGLRP